VSCKAGTCAELERLRQIAAVQDQLLTLLRGPDRDPEGMVGAAADSVRQFTRFFEQREGGFKAQLRNRDARIAQLEKQLEEAQQAACRQATPFARRRRKPPEQHRKPGRRPGQGTFSHRQRPPTIDRTFRQALEQCPRCGDSGPFHELTDYQTVQTDIERIQPVVTLFVGQRGTCPGCGERVHSRHPLQSSTASGAAGSSLGPRAVAAAADLHSRLGVSWDKTAEQFCCLLNLPVTGSGLYQAVMRVAAAAEPTYSQLAEALRAALAVYVDETGWRIGLASAWLWVFCTPDTVLFDIRTRKGARGHRTVIDTLGKHFAGVLASDGFPAYDADALDHWLKQKCLAHLLKALHGLDDCAKAQVVAFTGEAVAVLLEAIGLKRCKATLDEEQFATRRTAIEADLDRILEAYQGLDHGPAARLVRRMRKQRPHLLTFLYHDPVAPTNNLAERNVRPAVCARKTQGCNRTARGARAHAVLASIATTIRCRGGDILQWFTELGRTATPPPLPPPQPSG
jgi:transposase